MDKRIRNIYAGLAVMTLILGGCASSGADSETTVVSSDTAGTPVSDAAGQETADQGNVDQAETTANESAEGVTAAGETAEEAGAEGTSAETSDSETSGQENAGQTGEGTADGGTGAGETAAETEAGGSGSGETAAETSAASGTEDEGTSGAVLSDLYDEISRNVGLNSPMTVPEEFIYNYFGIDVSGAEDYLFVMSEMATSAETIVIVKTDEANRQATADALETVRSQKANEMENYLPDQYDIVDRSRVEETGDYVWLVISENADAIKSIIEAGLQ